MLVDMSAPRWVSISSDNGLVKRENGFTFIPIFKEKETLTKNSSLSSYMYAFQVADLNQESRNKQKIPNTLSYFFYFFYDFLIQEKEKMKQSIFERDLLA